MGGSFSCYVASFGFGCGDGWPGMLGLALGLVLLAALAATVLYARRTGRPRIENVDWQAQPAEPLDLRRAGVVAGLFLAYTLAFFAINVIMASTLSSRAGTFVRIVPGYAWVELLCLVVAFLLVLTILATVAYLRTGRSLFPSRNPSLRSWAYSLGGFIGVYVALSLYDALLLPSHPEIWWIPFAVVNLAIAVALVVNVRRFWRLVIVRQGRRLRSRPSRAS
jgi:hypothetical protein